MIPMKAENANNTDHKPVRVNGNPVKQPAPDPNNGTARAKVRVPNHLPERYSIKTANDEKVLICLEAPNLNIHIEAGLAVSGSVARKSPGGTIFLDGVAQCEPFMDHERQVYNLDHHEGCVRAFTFSSCEQALVMYMKGLDLQAREWHIFANEPDLDTILAIWILLNHARIGGLDSTQRRVLFALVRYEGLIDALGLELKELSALPPELMRKIQRVIDHLRSEELSLKREGRWEKTDYLIYTAGILHKIDQIFYKARDFEDYQGVEELARIDLNDQRIAAVVQADMGIYEVEPHLNKIYGNRLGVVFLKKGRFTYTVRQMDLFMPITLQEIYDRLNFVDPAVKCRTKTNKWGGANDIGGSPRKSGTRLTPLEIASTCKDAVEKKGFLIHAARYGTTTALTGLIVLCAYFTGLFWRPDAWLQGLAPSVIWLNPRFGFALSLLLGTLLSSLFIVRRHPWQYGWMLPCGRQWWFFLPVSLLSGFSGGIWVPGKSILANLPWTSQLLIVIICIPLAVEMLFRGQAHGLLAQNAQIQREDTRWFISWPALGSAILYTGFILLLFFMDRAWTLPSPIWPLLICTATAFLFGLAAAMARERAHSFIAPLFLHMISAALVMIPTAF
jgi:hypothetical protein